MRFGHLLVPAAASLLLACGQDGVSPTSSTGATGGGTSSSTTGGQGGGGGAPGPGLKVMDWNTQNFFNDQNDSAAADETVKSTADYTEQREAIAAVIAGFDPDVIVFAEVENLKVLEDLNLDLGGKYVDLQVPEGNDPRGLDVAAMSKIPFDQVVTHKDDSFLLEGTAGPMYKFARNVPEFHLTVEGRKIVLLGVHYRSKGQPAAMPPIPDDPDKRLAEAQRTRAIADGLTAADPELGVIILGDTNDLPGSFPLLELVGADPDKYRNAPDEIAIADRWTYNYMGALELIDHQLSNKVLAPMLDPGSVTIPHSQQIDDIGDHSPIVATYLVTGP